MLCDYDKLTSRLPALKQAYAQARVFPHIAIDNFLDQDSLAEAARYFPPVGDEGWIHYVHFNERKGGLNKREYIPEPLRAIIDELNSPRFVGFLEALTCIPGLTADPDLEGGGLHQIERGGFLNIHADFTAHPHHRLWRRRVNVILYLNEDWQEEYGGHLELWTKDMHGCFEKILPVFNRCVIFNTDKESFHGHPHPLTCPPERTRRSIALYYFTAEEKPPVKIATNYQAKPGDGIKALFIFLDKKILSAYNHLKGALGMNDDAVSKALRMLGKVWRI